MPTMHIKKRRKLKVGIKSLKRLKVNTTRRGKGNDMVENAAKMALFFGTIAVLSDVAYSEEVTFEEELEVVPSALTAFQRIAKVKDSVLRVEEMGEDIGRIKADLELMPGYCVTNQCGSFRQMDRETKRQIDREYKLLRAKLFEVSERLDEIETRMENYGNILTGELLRQKMKNGELANGQECLGWTALDFVEATNKTSGIQQRVAYPLGTGCPSVVLELSQGSYCFSWYHESDNSTLYKADTNQNLAVMLKLFPGKGKSGGLMTRHFEKWRWKQFKKSDLKDGECYVVLDGENVFVNRSSGPVQHSLPNTESFSEAQKRDEKPRDKMTKGAVAAEDCYGRCGL